MGRYRSNIICNRIIKFVLMCSFAFILLIMRLYWVQIRSHESLGYQALRQRGKEISIYPERGVIYDANLIPLTNANRITTLFAFKDNAVKNADVQNLIFENSSLSKNNLLEILGSDNEIIEIPLDKPITDTMLSKDILTIEKILRYDDRNLLSHTIGYVNKSENRGESGIEKLFDDVLGNAPGGSFFIELDEKQKIFLDGSYFISKQPNTIEPNGVKLTIDYHIQQIVEDVLDINKVNGAVIVTDIETGDIKALASRPNFKQEEVEYYFNRDDMALYNKAIQVAYPPGSLFKLIVLLTALEKDCNCLGREFYCKGYEEIGNTIIKCNKETGHGYIDLKEAFIKSCNSAFIQLGQRLGSTDIIRMADKLGFGSRVNIGLLEEIEGNLPKGDELHGPAIGNISIGQGSIEVTPLQMTNLMMIIANNGMRKSISVIEGITDKDGHIIKAFNKEKPEMVLSEKNCKILKECLIEVVEKGTAKNMDLEDIGGAGGKTGSAQAILNRKETIHGWFCGFYPKENPKHVITVLVEDGISGSKTATPIFDSIAKRIFEINR